MSIEERLLQLEASNRRLRWAMVWLFASSACVLAIGSAYGAQLALLGALGCAAAAVIIRGGIKTRTPRLLRARKFEVVGDNGNVVVALGETTDGNGAVATYNSAATPREHFESSSGLSLILNYQGDGLYRIETKNSSATDYDYSSAPDELVEDPASDKDAAYSLSARLTRIARAKIRQRSS